ncbi:unnamed protein product [Acanthosepion pharaonis]|uniref:Uncharacterized protein n=1 Tax=Acanthosepion pharaonis TaxID=158019 RepID=A0A812DFV4_ACAPH|nr:unnamed protein product [Sepia pharaonis]
MITCPVSPPVAIVQWFYQDKAISDDNQWITVNGTSLIIDEFQVGDDTNSHEGTYYCVATTSLGALVSQPATLQLPQFSGFTTKSSNITVEVIEGGAALFPCGQVQSVPRAHLSIEKIDNAKVIMNNTFVLPSNNFIMNNVHIEDSGTYQCLATNPVTNETAASNQMIVLSVIPLESAQNQSPYIFGATKPTIMCVKEGDTIILECAAFAKPAPKITWKKYGGHLLNIKKENSFASNLVIKKVHHRDKGTYICLADNGIGNKVQKVFQIEVLEPPKADEGHVVVEEGHKAILSCVTNNKSNFSIKWFHNGKHLTKSKNIRIRDTSLVIKSSQHEHAGLYQCMFHNQMGHSYAVIQLEIKSTNRAEDKNTQLQPNGKVDKNIKSDSQGGSSDKIKNTNMVPPSKPKVTKHSDTSVLVEWTVPANDGMAITFFVVQYKEVSPNKGEWQTDDEQIPPKVRKVTVDRLRPGGTYKFRIAAVYSNQDNAMGINSERFTLVADGDHISEKRLVQGPTIVKVDKLVVDKNYALVVEWKYIHVKSTPIDGFIIFYKRYDENVAYTKITLHEPEVRMHIIRNLEPAKAYSIKMQCFNKVSYSVDSNHVVKKTSSPENWEDTNYIPHVPSLPSGYHPRTIWTSTVSSKDNYESTNSTQSSSELLYKILGGILAIMVLVLLMLMAMCCIKQRQQRNMMAAMNSCEHKKYMNGGHYPVNGNISNGHIGHHTHHSRNYRHQISGQSISKPYAFNDMIDSYTSTPACSKSLHMYHSDISSDVYDDMYNHFSQGDSNCNSIDQSKSPQIMQVKHLGSDISHLTTSLLDVDTEESAIEHVSSSHKKKSEHILPSPNGVSPIYDSYEKVNNNANSSHNICDSLDMIPNTKEHSQPCDNFLVINNSSHYLHSSKPKKKRWQQYLHEHSTRDQATNTDISSNEGTLELSPIKKHLSNTDKNEIPPSNYSLSSNSKPVCSIDPTILEENVC